MGWVAPQLSPIFRVTESLPPSPLPPQPASREADRAAARATEAIFFMFMFIFLLVISFLTKFFNVSAWAEQLNMGVAHSPSKRMTIFFMSFGGWMMFSKTWSTWSKGM